MTMNETLPRVFMFNGATPRTAVVIRTATGMVAYQTLAFQITSLSFSAHTLSIWMKATLKCRYAWLPQIKLKLKKRPMGTIARRYTRPVMGTFFRESRMVVKRARNWVMTVAKTKCHVVRKMGKSVRIVRAS
jgi:hypothetical protein